MTGLDITSLEHSVITETPAERYEFCNPYITLEEKYREYEMHLTDFVKYMKEQS